MNAWVEHDKGEALYPHEAIEGALHALLDHGAEVDAGHWQGYPTQGKPDLLTKEIINLTFTAHIPVQPAVAADECKPNLPWAEVEFEERVGRQPRNPHASLVQWPHWREQSDSTMHNGMFSHTYSERFWPRGVYADGTYTKEPPLGMRYRWGDLDDVIDLLVEHPHTRQATFPIFFPEDTGARHGGRIPCTLHYHFLMRDNRLHLFYPIRSCDAYRHFRDDVFMAMRLCQWVLNEVREADLRSEAPHGYNWDRVKPGVLCFTAYSFHVHMGDMAHLLRENTHAAPATR